MGLLGSSSYMPRYLISFTLCMDYLIFFNVFNVIASNNLFNLFHPGHAFTQPRGTHLRARHAGPHPALPGPNCDV